MIYFIEDDKSINEALFYTLKSSGFEVKGFELPSAFRSELKKQVPDLILLDIMLPEENGLEILKKLKSNSNTDDIPVIMLTAKNSENDKVIGLDSGADDYITKPFSMLELISRIRAILRRTVKKESSQELKTGNLVVDTKKHLIFANGKYINLTYKEYQMLLLLLQNKGVVFSRNSLLSQILGYKSDGKSRTVDSHIRTLRIKLGECGNYIETIRGFGYKMAE